MDLSRPVTYRSLNLNNAVPEAGTGRIAGIMLDEAIIGQVNGVGYTEKRSQADGRDASDVYLDSRRVTLQGTVYGLTAADAHDRFQQMRSAISPTGAFTDLPGAYGYLPLFWDEPTGDTRYPITTGTTRFRHLYLNVRPLITPEQRVGRDRTGGRPALGVAYPFVAQFEAKDPRIYVDPAVTVDYIDNTTGQSGSWVNRGDYPAPLNIMLVLNAPHAAGTYNIGVGGSQMQIAIQAAVAGSTPQIYRYDGFLKVLTLEENDVEVLRMDLLTFTHETTHPLIAPSVVGDPAAPWAFTSTIPLAASSRMWFNEAYA